MDDNGPERGGDDIVAAEYVLGVLPADERRQAASPHRRRAGVRAPCRSLGRSTLRRSPQPMPRSRRRPSVKIAIDRRLFSGGSAAGQPATSAAPGLLSSLGFWRGLAVAALAALALYIALPFINPPPVEAPQSRLVASLARRRQRRALSRRLRRTRPATSALSHVSGERAAGQRFRAVDDRGPATRRFRWASFRPAPRARLPVERCSRAKLGLRRGACRSASSPPAVRPPAQPTGPVVAAGDLEDDLVEHRFRIMRATARISGPFAFDTAFSVRRAYD